MMFDAAVFALALLAGEGPDGVNDGSFAATAQGATVTTEGRSSNQGTTPEGGGDRDGGTRRAHSTPPPRVLTPACSANVPPNSPDALCGTALANCEHVNGGASYLAWTYEFSPTIAGGDPFWHIIRTHCVVPGDPAGEGTPELSLREFRRLPLPPGGVHVQPAEGPVLINVPTNVYVDAKPVRLETTVVGVRVEVEATPLSFTWSFGDGKRLVTKDHGARYPDMRTTHTYVTPGHYDVVLTTTYTGRYRRLDVPGSPWLPVDGTAQVPSPPVTLELIEARGVLVP